MKYPVPLKMLRSPVSMTLLSRIFALGIVLLLCNAQVFSQTPESQIEPITSAIRNRDYDKAVELSRAALQGSPGSAQLWTLQGIALASKGNTWDALAAFQRALKIAPNTIAALAGAAQIEYQAGNAAAVPLLNRLVRLRPDEPTAHAMLAVMEY